MKKIITISVLFINCILLAISFLISPYREELYLAERQINDDGVIVLNLIYITIIGINILFFFSKKKINFKKTSGIALSLISLFSLINLILISTI